MSPATRTKLGFHQFLEFESSASEKHEYHDGRVIRMAGASDAHVQITTNIAGEVFGKLKGSRCLFRGADQMVFAPNTNKSSYPDGTVVCGEPDYVPNSPISVLLNPTVVFEVLSPSTEKNDRVVKFKSYVSIESLREIVLVHQDEHWIEVFRREAGGIFGIHHFEGFEETLVLESLNIEIPLRDLYANVSIPQRELELP